LLQDQNGPLFTRDSILFSRFIPSSEPHLLRQRGKLRCLAFFSNPSNLADYPTAERVTLAPIDFAKESRNLTEALRGTKIKLDICSHEVPDGEFKQSASIRNIKIRPAPSSRRFCRTVIERLGHFEIEVESSSPSAPAAVRPGARRRALRSRARRGDTLRM